MNRGRIAAGGAAAATFASIAASGGNTVLAEYRALPANLSYDAGTGLVNSMVDSGPNGYTLTNAGGAVRPAFAEPSPSTTIANDGLLPGMGYIKHTRTSDTVLQNASFNRPGTHFFAMLMRPTTYVSSMRYLASLGASNIQVFYAPTNNLGIFTGGAVVSIAGANAPINEWILVMGQWNGGTDYVREKFFYATGNAGTSTSTGMQVGRDVAATTAGNFDWHWLAFASGSFTLAQRLALRNMVNGWAAWDSLPGLKNPPAGEDKRVVGDGDSKMAGNGSGGGDLPYLNYVTTTGFQNRRINKASGGDTLLGAGGITAQYPTGTGVAPSFVTVTNTDFSLKQIYLIDIGTNDLVGGASASSMLTDASFGLDVLIGLARATGYKLAIMTQCRGNYTGPQETERLAFNAGIRARAASDLVVVEVADTVASPTIIPGTFRDGVYWSSGVPGDFHTTTLTAQTIKAPIISAAIANL
jgi:hypothetical protein